MSFTKKSKEGTPVRILSGTASNGEVGDPSSEEIHGGLLDKGRVFLFCFVLSQSPTLKVTNTRGCESYHSPEL